MGATSAEAIVAAETAHRLEPANREATQNLLRLYLRLDLRSDATALVESAFPSSPPQRSEAWMAVLNNDLLRARKLLHSDQEDEASARLDAAEADLQRAARPQIIARGIADVRRSIAENRGSKIYDAAFAEYERGEPEAARDLLQQALSALPPEGPVTASCRHLLDVIDHPEKYVAPPAPQPAPTDDEVDRLNRMLAAGELTEAIVFLAEIRDRTAGPQRRWIENKITELQRTIDYNTFVDTYNTAVELYNRQEFKKVVTLLDEYLGSSSADSPQAASARSLRRDALRAIEKSAANGP
jgi:tetratricopeptide (TPR) repeat protein